MLAGALAAASAGSAQAGTGGSANAGRGPAHVFVIMMENHATDQLLGNTADAPFINSLTHHAIVMGNYLGVTHPSLPNYLATFSGDFQGIWDDCGAGASITCAPEEFVPGSGDSTDGNYLTPQQIASASATPHLFAGQNLVDQLEANGLTWRAYFQSLPADKLAVYGPVIGGTTVKLYAQKHNPFVYFSDVVNSPARMANIVSFDGFAGDLASGNVPNFVWISPDQCHDMHGISPSGAALIGLPTCGYPDSGLDHGAIQLGDQFLSDTVHAITSSQVWRTSDSRLVILWDENDYSGNQGTFGSPTGVNGYVLGGGHTLALELSSRSNRSGMFVTRPLNHYSFLGGLEQAWNLGCLANTCGLTGRSIMPGLEG